MTYLTIPRGVVEADPDLRDAVAELERVRIAHDAIVEHAWQLRKDGLPDAERADQEAIAAAVTAGKTPPQPEHAQRVTQQLAQADAAVSGHALAVERAEQAVRIMLNERKETLARTVDDALTEARDRFADAIGTPTPGPAHRERRRDLQQRTGTRRPPHPHRSTDPRRHLDAMRRARDRRDAR